MKNLYCRLFQTMTSRTLAGGPQSTACKPIPHHSQLLNHSGKLKLQHFPNNVFLITSSYCGCHMSWIRVGGGGCWTALSAVITQWAACVLCSAHLWKRNKELDVPRITGIAAFLQTPESNSLHCSLPPGTQIISVFSGQFTLSSGCSRHLVFLHYLAWKSHLLWHNAAVKR